MINLSSLQKWINGLESANLQLIDLSGVSYNPINETFKLSNDVSVNYMMHFIKN